MLGKKILFSADKVSEPAIKIQNNKNMSLVDIYLVYFFLESVWRILVPKLSEGRVCHRTLQCGRKCDVCFCKTQGINGNKENVHMMYQSFHFERVWLLFRDFDCYI